MIGGSSGSGTQTAQIPDELKPLVSTGAAETQQLQQLLPLSLFAQPSPRQVADLGALTKWGLNAVPSLAQVEPAAASAFGSVGTGVELSARPIPDPMAELAQWSLLNEVAGGPVGSSPATMQGMEAWKNLVLPTVENEMVGMGLGRSGDLLKAVTLSGTQAAVPLLQTEIANRVGAINQLQQVANAETQRFGTVRQSTLSTLSKSADQLMQLAQTMYDQRIRAIDEALKGGQITTDKQQQLNDAAFEDFMRLQQLATQSGMGAFTTLLPNLIGANTSQQGLRFGIK